jgi:phytanoyl-CoA hydroxylase
MLSTEQLATFERDGFLVLPNFVSRERCDELKAHVEGLLDEIDPSAGTGLTVFDTSHQAHGNDEWFLDSGDKIRWFFEDGAVVNGALTVPLRLAVNKLGHAMHDLDPAFETFSRTPELAAVPSCFSRCTSSSSPVSEVRSISIATTRSSGRNPNR